MRSMHECRTTVEFVEWLDATQREQFVSVTLSRYVFAAEVDAYELWSLLVLEVWKNAKVAADFEHEGQVRKWLSYMRAFLWRRMRSEYRKRRGEHHKCKRRAELIISELEDEEVAKVFNSLVDDRREPEMGWSQEGWFSKAMEALTPRQHMAIQMTVCGRLSLNEAEEIAGKHLQSGKRQGLRKIRKMIESGELDVEAA